ncbi:hypothetical protein [Bdellovibrio bacteriovorus]|uniref:hypothetical protein n=1 Tax=Bdellovibrio bacteriovorus TaxID=959 RepID=UPI003D07B244
MSSVKINVKSPNPWETIGMFFGYFAVAKDIPSVLRTLMIPKLVPDCLKAFLLGVVGNGNFWLLIFFTALTVLTYILLWTTSHPQEEEDSDITITKRADADGKASVIKTMKRYQVLRIIRSLGLVWIRERILDFWKVFLYGTFKRPSNWESDPTRMNHIDRITFDDHSGWEFQYSKDYRSIIARFHPSTTDTYEESQVREPTLKEVGLLMIASNYFPFWYLGYLFRKLF